MSTEFQAVKVFVSYTHKDEARKDSLMAHLKTLEREKLVSIWHDRKIIAGAQLNTEIQAQLEQSEVFLLLLSSDFISSEYCYSTEMKHALERHKKGTAIVIPIIMRACSWHAIPQEPFPLGELLALPKDGKAVSRWKPQDVAFVNVVDGVRASIEEFRKPAPKPASSSKIDQAAKSTVSSSAIEVAPPAKSSESKSVEAGQAAKMPEISIISFVSEWKERVSDQPGFKKGYHFEPEVNTTRAAAFIRTIAEESVQAELDIVFDQIIASNRYEPKHVRKIGDSIKTPEFLYQLTVLLNNTDTSEVLWRRELIVNPLERLGDIGPIFDDDFDKLELWFEKSHYLNIEALIDAFSKHEKTDWKLQFPSSKSKLSLTNDQRTASLSSDGCTFSSGESAKPHVLFSQWKETFTALSKQYNSVPFSYNAPSELSVQL